MADPRPFTHTQSDGTKVTLRLRGDEFFHWHEDAEGFTVVRAGDNFVYGMLDAENHLTPTAWLAGKINPRDVGLAPRLLPPPGVRPPNLNHALKPHHPWATTKQNPGPRIAPNGTVKNLVILCKFSNHTFPNHTRPREDYDVLFNQVGGHPVLAPTGSVRDAYTENSYGIVTLDSTVLAWVTLPRTQAFYAGTNNGLGNDYPNNAQKMVEDALALADPLVDFGQFDIDRDGFIDAIDIIHSGYGAEFSGAAANAIWSHAKGLPSDWVSADKNADNESVKVSRYHTEPALWATGGTDITRIGVICHETGHFFGLPDLYDTDNEASKLSAGIGTWCMMANSWGFDDSQLHPPHFSAWCKIDLGWVAPTVLVTPGSYSITQVETAQEIYKITWGFPSGEYLLIENRQPVGLESIMVLGGLAIWHIDEKVPDNTREGFPGQPGWPGNGQHYKVALLQADGLFDLERNVNNGDVGDLYQFGGATYISGATVPNTDKYQSSNVYSSFNAITGIGSTGPTMSFCYGSDYYLNKNIVCPGFQTGVSNCTIIPPVGPYQTFSLAASAAPRGSILHIRSANYSEANMTVNRCLQLRAENGTVSIGRP